MSDRIAVVFSTDANYLPATAVALRSLCAQTRHAGGLDIWVLHTRLSPMQLDLLRRAASGRTNRLFPVELSDGEVDLPVQSDYISRATFGRLHIANVLPASCDRAIFLDSDILVSGDVTELWQIDLQGCTLAAALEQTAPTLGSDGGLENLDTLGLDPGLPYFNAGVLLIDLHAWRRRAVGTRAVEHIRRFRPRLMDQDALNAVVARDWHELDPVWNLTSYWFRTRYRQRRNRPLLASARIIHFVGHRKPWTRANLWARASWYSYLSELTGQDGN